jgi:hypothetical protein
MEKRDFQSAILGRRVRVEHRLLQAARNGPALEGPGRRCGRRRSQAALAFLSRGFPSARRISVPSGSVGLPRRVVLPPFVVLSQRAPRLSQVVPLLPVVLSSQGRSMTEPVSSVKKISHAGLVPSRAGETTAVEASRDKWQESEQRPMRCHRMSEMTHPVPRAVPSLRARMAGCAWLCRPP